MCLLQGSSSRCTALRSYGEDRFDEVLARELSKEGQRQLTVSEATAAKAAAHKLARYGHADTTHTATQQTQTQTQITGSKHTPHGLQAGFS